MMQLPWYRNDWQETVDAWVQERLAAQGIHPIATGEPVRKRPWSVVYRFPTDQGTVFFKAVTPAQPHEPKLVHFLARRFPYAVPEVLAVDEDQAWILMRDAGTALRTVLQSSRESHYWLAASKQYAGIQKSLISERETLLAMGVPDRRLSRLPEVFTALIQNPGVLEAGTDPEGLLPEDIEELSRELPRVMSLCERLAGFGIPETIEHNDLHDNNLFVSGGQVRIADWADSSIAHPFFTWTVTMRSISWTLGLESGAPFLAEVRDTYLTEWTDLFPAVDPIACLTVANCLASLCRAQTWFDALRYAEPGEQAEYQDSVRSWLKIYLTQARLLSAA